MRARTSLLFLASVVGAAVLAAGCANGNNRNRDAGMFMRDGDVPPPNEPCGGGGVRCCAGSTCELGLRCSRDVCCIQAGSAAHCESSSDCCTGLTCENPGPSGVCVTPRGGACTGSTDCAPRHACVMGTCRSIDGGEVPGPAGCGASGAVCCDGFTCSSGMVCMAGTCGGCGEEGQACCDGATACISATLGCTRGAGGMPTCTRIPSPDEACGTIDRPACGTDGLPVDPGSPGACETAVCEGDLRCVGGTCLDPDDEGGMGQPCGPRGGCDGGLICTYGAGTPTCEPTPEDCGRDMMMCCDTGSTSGGTCEGALHCQTGGCTTCAGPSITCLLSGALPGQECCNGAVCRPAPLVPRCCVGAGETCVNSADCCGFMMCRDGMCSAGNEGSFCIDSSECAEGLTCQTFTCQPAEMCIEPNTDCSGSGMCCGGLHCAPDVDPEMTTSVPETRCCAGAGTACQDSFECCGEMLCSDGECACQGEDAYCWSDVDCCDGFSCVAGTCQSTTACAEENEMCPGGPPDCCGLDCRPDAWSDIDDMSRWQCCSANRCLEQEDCCGEMICVDAICQPQATGETCAHDFDCTAGEICNDGTCGPP